MASICIDYVGGFSEGISKDIILVEDDRDYIAACRAIDTSVHNDSTVKVWVRSVHHFSWLKDFLEQLDISAEFRVQTARTILSDHWNIEIPEWLTDNEIIEQGLLTLELGSNTRDSFENRLLMYFFGPSFAKYSLEPADVSAVVMPLVDDKTAETIRKYPVLKKCLEYTYRTWKEEAADSWVSDVCDMLSEKPVTVWRWLTARSLLHGYPDALLERILPMEHVKTVRRISPELVTDIPLETEIREEAVTQIDVLMRDVVEKVESRDQFLKILDWMSGRLFEEFGHIKDLLGKGSFQPSRDDIERVKEKFLSCPGVKRSALNSLKYHIMPDFPPLPKEGETWNPEKWIDWTVNVYIPFRDWQIHTGVYKEELENTVGEFSRWYVSSYIDIQSNINLGLTHVLHGIEKGEKKPGLTIVLIVDCLPVTYFDLLDGVLREKGFYRQKTSYRYASLPTVTHHNKPQIIAGTGEAVQKDYRVMVKDRADIDWDIPSYYAGTLKEVSDLNIKNEEAIIIINYTEGDDILHSDTESKNRTYEEELSRIYDQLADTVMECCERWKGSRDNVILHLVTDHGACRILDEEAKSFDSKLVSKLFDNEKHRCATVTKSQAEKIPENLWNIGFRFKSIFSSNDEIHFLPRGHNTVHQVKKHVYLHGGVTPEEVIVPCAIYGLTAIPWKKPKLRFPHVEKTLRGDKAQFYIQRVADIEIEIQNLNESPIDISGFEVVIPNASIKELQYVTIPPGSTGTMKVGIYFNKDALESETLIIKILYVIGGEEYSIQTSLATEFKSAMKGGFNLKDL